MSSTQYTKKIALVDCNSFYVSCERLFNPKIRKRPVVVLSIKIVFIFQGFIERKL